MLRIFLAEHTLEVRMLGERGADEVERFPGDPDMWLFVVFESPPTAKPTSPPPQKRDAAPDVANCSSGESTSPGGSAGFSTKSSAPRRMASTTFGTLPSARTRSGRMRTTQPS